MKHILLCLFILYPSLFAFGSIDQNSQTFDGVHNIMLNYPKDYVLIDKLSFNFRAKLDESQQSTTEIFTEYQIWCKSKPCVNIDVGVVIITTRLEKGSFKFSKSEFMKDIKKSIEMGEITTRSNKNILFKAFSKYALFEEIRYDLVESGHFLPGCVIAKAFGGVFGGRNETQILAVYFENPPPIIGCEKWNEEIQPKKRERFINEFLKRANDAIAFE